MRTIMACLALCAGCAATPLQYDPMLGELRRDERAQAGAGARLAAVIGGKQLDRATLVAAVVAANRDVEAMRQAWRAAAAEVGAATALDDPMASYALAPLGIGSSTASFGQVIELRQKLPFPGKRRLAGEAALDDAEVSRADFQSAQLAVAELASQLYDDAFVNARALEINDRHRGLVEQMKKVAEARVASSRGSTQDALQAEVELGHLEHERVMLDTERETIVARINGLLHREPDAELPPPPSELPAPSAPPDVASLEQAAIAERPQEAAAAARVRANETRASLAERAYYPDFELTGSYNSMWDMPAHRWMLGVGLNLPIERGKRAAEVAAAQARVAQARAEAEDASDEIRVEVVRAQRELVEAIHVLHLYDERLVPAARAEVDAAEAGFTTGQNDFPAVINAERGLRDIELGAFRARADAWRRQAALDRAVGRSPQGGMP
ncbi:MAG TPA: TolC family protein [Kofleriaceae bacterium]|jgi:outer membrane protein TolC